MRHRNKLDKLSRSRAQRKALKRSLVRAVFINEQIKTTTKKAKVASAEVDKLITIAKRNDLHSRRLAYSYLNDHQLVKRLFEEIAPRFKDINGGYTRVLKYINRKGDNAQLSILELTQRAEVKAAPVAKAAKAAAKKEEPKVEKAAKPEKEVKSEKAAKAEKAAAKEEKPKKKGIFKKKDK